MDTLGAFALGQASRGNRVKVFDWIKAANLIKDDPDVQASAGLGGDWESTGGPIWDNNQPVDAEDTYTYLASTWATPELDIDGWVTDCWVYRDESPGWDAKTYWPKEALNIIEGKN